ncbi:MAG: hypothetical protein ABR521_01635 [Gaiellaceae bacterium]
MGSLLLRAGDRVMLLAEREQISALSQLFAAPGKRTIHAKP